MSSQVELARVQGIYAGRKNEPIYGLLWTTVLLVSVAVESLVLLGRLDVAYGFAVPAIAGLAGILAALVPRMLLTLLFASAPLLWALGGANVLQDNGAHLNLPMLVGFVVMVGFSHLLLVKDPDPGIELIRKLVLGMGLACIPAIFSAATLFSGAGAYLRVMSPYVVMFATLRYVRSKRDVLHYAKSMAYALLAVAIVFVIAYWRSDLWVEFGGYSRLGSLYFQTQELGVFLSVMLLVVILNYLLTRRKAYLFFLPFLFVALFLTYYRTAWVGGAVFLVLLTYQIKKSYGRRLLLLALALGLIFFSVVEHGFLRYGTSVNSAVVADKILSGRLLVDALAIESYINAPLYNKIFGIGFFQAKEVTGLVLPQGFMIHDDYLAYLIEAGVFALPLYLAILIALFRRSREGRRHARERVASEMCGASSILIVTVMIMGIPGALYTQVLTSIYIYGVMGLMLNQSRFLNSRPPHRGVTPVISANP